MLPGLGVLISCDIQQEENGSTEFTPQATCWRYPSNHPLKLTLTLAFRLKFSSSMQTTIVQNKVSKCVRSIYYSQSLQGISDPNNSCNICKNVSSFIKFSHFFHKTLSIRMEEWLPLFFSFFCIKSLNLRPLL